MLNLPLAHSHVIRIQLAIGHRTHFSLLNAPEEQLLGPEVVWSSYESICLRD